MQLGLFFEMISLVSTSMGVDSKASLLAESKPHAPQTVKNQGHRIPKLWLLASQACPWRLRERKGPQALYAPCRFSTCVYIDAPILVSASLQDRMKEFWRPRK